MKKLKDYEDVLSKVIQMNLRLLLVNVPSCCLSIVHNLKDIEPFHANKFISAYVTVIRIGPSLARE